MADKDDIREGKDFGLDVPQQNRAFHVKGSGALDWGMQNRLARIFNPASGKTVMLDFYADWCVSCKEMEAFTFSDPKVRAQLDQMLLLQADVTANTDEDKALLKRFSLFGPPGIIFFDAEGREIKGLRVIGYQNAERFLKTLSLATAPEPLPERSK